MKLRILFLLILVVNSCGIAQIDTQASMSTEVHDTITPAADLPDSYLPFLIDKEIAIVTNQTGLVKGHHIVDFLLHENINVVKIFAPEHGFRGESSNGAEVLNGKDIRTGIPIRSIYGKKKKPSKEDLEGIQAILFDIQDVGVRYYTYLSSLAYTMEAAAENNIPFIVLDRPNPNAHYIDGPVLDTAFASIVGLHPVPIVYGMTIGEYARMLKGEGWINESQKLDLTVVMIEHYTHDSIYKLQVAPSPNLPNSKSIYLYPSLCYFEGANVSVGRGTESPFQIIGFPGFKGGDTTFTPHSIPGKSEYPPFKDEQCNGLDLTKISLEELISKKEIDWTYVWNMHQALGKESFFLDNNFFDLLAGSKILRKALNEKWSIEQFRAEYKSDVEEFKKIREKYLMYD
jgi:uncharacterized protein YbbC (DUF1343 family)